MQEALLRRNGHDGPTIGEKYRLTQLEIPVTQRELLAFEGAQREFGPF